MTVRSRFFAMTYDRQIARVDKAGLGAVRKDLLAGATGRVLEIGSGTGPNLPYYGTDIESLTLTEPDVSMLRKLQRRVGDAAASVTVLRAPAEDLPFDDDAFDVAVSALVLCGVNDQPRALRELRRVLRPGGRLLFVEHVRSDDPGVAAKQDRMNWLNRIVAGCDCNRPTLACIRDAGFVVESAEAWTLPKAPSFVSPAVIGSATAPAGAPSPDPRVAVRDAI